MVTKKTSEKEAKTVATEGTVQSIPKKPISPLWWILGTLIFVVILILALGAVKRAMYIYSYDQGQNSRRGHMTDRSFGPGSMRESLRDSKSGSFVSGVITAIDSDTLTVAGSGTTKQIKTTDTTEYYGAAQPAKVNDSVRIMGTTDGDSFTATRVMISRQ